MIKKIILSMTLFALISLFLIGLEPAIAASAPGAPAPNLQGQISAQLGGATSKAEVGNYVDPRQVAASIISVFLSIIGTIFFVLLIISGYWLVTARGDETKVEKAQNTIRSAIIGILVVVMAYAITSFVSSRLLSDTSTAQTNSSR